MSMKRLVKKFSKALPALVIFLAFAVQGSAQSSVVVTGVNVNLRTSPTTATDNILKGPGGKSIHPAKGEILQCSGSTRGFYHVVYGGLDCYISKQFSKAYFPRAAVNRAPSRVIVTGTHVRLRLGPSLNHKALCYNNGTPIYPEKGDVLSCVGQKGGFYTVMYDDQVVYISKKYAKPYER